MQISEAITRYNKVVRKSDEPKMTQKLLGEKILPGRSEATAKNYMSRWDNGQKLNVLTVQMIKDMCDILKVDVIFLFSDVIVDNEFHIGDLSYDSIEKIYKSTGLDLNELFRVKPI